MSFDQHEKLFCDLETYSEVPIKNGTHAYAEHAEVLLFTYAFGDEEVKCWDAASGEHIPADLLEGLLNPEVLTVWHNGGMFDHTILKHAELLTIPHERIFDTMVCAFAHSLPGALDTLCDVFGISEDKAKVKEGKQLIQLFCKPMPKNSKLRRATRETHPEKWEQFINYAKHDISAMREVYRKLPRWNYAVGHPEHALWVLDQKINQRGVAVDLALAKGAIAAASKAKELLAEETMELTEGAVGSTTQRDVLLAHIFEQYGIPLADLQMDTIERRLSDPDIPDQLKDLLRIRLQASTTSVRKYNTLLKAVSSDGRLRGLLQFAGAGRTARWSGRVFQPQNLPRPTMKAEQIEFAIETIKAGAVELFYPNVMATLSNAIRGTMIAPPKKKLVVADLSNIEGRVAAWLAGEEWKLKYFRDYDAGLIEFDNYVMAYAKSFSISPNVVLENKKTGDGTMRQIGKVQELMLQYEGGVGAFVTGAATYRIDLDDMAEKAIEAIPADVIREAENFYVWSTDKKKGKGSDFGLSKNVFVVCDSLKRLWREAHPAISSIWPELRDTVKESIQNPNVVFRVRKLRIIRAGAWLRIILPSGRNLCYPSPRVEEDGTISYMGMNQYTRKWCRLKTYGGKLLENITQAVARDVMAHALPLAEEQGYETVLTVHDELLTETPDEPEFTADTLGSIMATCPAWAPDLPLAAAGYEAYRYRKD